MYSVYRELRASYFSLLAGNVLIDSAAVPIYYGQVPAIAAAPNPDNYVLMNAMYSTNFNDGEQSYLNTIVQLLIVTKAYQNNAGVIKDSIADQIYALCWPNVQSKAVQIVNGYVFDTKMQTDTDQVGLSDGEKKVMNRVIQFRHLIQLDPNPYPPSGTGVIYYNVQETNADPTNFTQSINQDGDLPISVDYGTQNLPIYFWLAVPDIYTTKEDWDDLNDEGNSGKIGADTDLFEVRAMVINTIDYTLYMTRYKTGWNGHSAQVKYY